jgi:hypothetical protein
MAITNKDFKVKHGLIVEGAQGTINGNTILTEVDGDAYILDLIGGETLITSVDADQLQVVSGELSVKAEVFDAFGSAEAAETAANEYTDDRETAITTAYEAYADQAELDAVATAESYTDGRETAITTAYEAYADQAELDAVATAESYTDGRETAITTAYEAYADQAEVDAKAYTDTRETAITTAYQNYADQAETDAKAYTDTRETAITTAYQSYADTAEQDAKDYADAAVAAIVDGAPELLDTLNELAAALQDNPDVISTIQETAAGKQDALTAGANIDITDDVISVTGLDAADISDFNTAALSATESAYDAAGAAATVQDNLDDHIDDSSGVHGVTGSVVGTTDTQTLSNKTVSGRLNFDNSDSWIEKTNGALEVKSLDGQTIVSSATDAFLDGLGGSAYVRSFGTDGFVSLNDSLKVATYSDGGTAYYKGSDPEDEIATHGHVADAIDALDTDDIEEGATNLYFTSARAKTSAAELLTGATLSNITITGNGSGLTITAEDGIAGKTTDDLDEGEENLYFTDERAVDAVSGAEIYPDAVIVDNLSKIVAGTSTLVASPSQVTAYAWAKADYRSAKFLVKCAYGDHTEVSEVILTLDVNDNIAMTEYATVGTYGATMTITADISGTDVRLRVTTVNNNSTVNVFGTLLK